MSAQGEEQIHVAELDYSAIGAEPLEAEDPRQIGAFPIRAVLGSGGMGRVYLGVAPDGYAAVKSVLPYLANDRVFLQHFGQELANQAKLPSGISSRLLAADLTARPPWFATEYVAGVTLHDAVHLNGRSLPADTLWTLLRELATRLQAVAALNIVHRDLKPSNVMLTEDGLTLIDFGVARAADQSSLTATGTPVGTPAYMAPEQARAVKKLTPAVDVFALGSMLTFAATGMPAFGEGSGADLFYRIVHQDPELDDVTAVDPELGALVARCLAKDPAERPSAAELLELATAKSGAGETPDWPEAVAEHIRVRAEFAAAAPTGGKDAEAKRDASDDTEFDPAPHEDPLPPLPDDVETIQIADPDKVSAESDTDIVVDAGVGGGAGDDGYGDLGDHSGKRKRRPSRKTLALVLPLLLTAGATGSLYALHIAPFTATPSADNAHGSGNNVLAGGTATGTPGPNRSATSTASPGKPSPSGAAHQTGRPTSTVNGQGSGTGGVTGGGGGSSGGSNTGVSGGANGGSGGPGPGSTGGSGATGGSNTTGGSTGTTGGTSGGGGSSPGVVSFSTPSMLKNVGPGTCLTSEGMAMGAASCTGGSAEGWTAVAGPGNEFEIVNQSLGYCLVTTTTIDPYLTSCSDATSGQYWEIGTQTSKGATLKSANGTGGCLEWTDNFTYTTPACNPGDSGQIWFDDGHA